MFSFLFVNIIKMTSAPGRYPSMAGDVEVPEDWSIGEITTPDWNGNPPFLLVESLQHGGIVDTEIVDGKLVITPGLNYERSTLQARLSGMNSGYGGQLQTTFC